MCVREREEGEKETETERTTEKREILVFKKGVPMVRPYLAQSAYSRNIGSWLRGLGGIASWGEIETYTNE